MSGGGVVTAANTDQNRSALIMLSQLQSLCLKFGNYTEVVIAVKKKKKQKAKQKQKTQFKHRTTYGKM